MKAVAPLLFIAAIALPLLAAAGPGDSPSIFWAALANDVNIAKNYVSNGESVNLVDEFGMSPLMHAADKGNVEMVKYLLSVGADPYRKSKGGLTAIQFSRTEEVREVLRSWMQNRSNY